MYIRQTSYNIGPLNTNSFGTDPISAANCGRLSCSQLCTVVPRTAFHALPADVQPLWVRFHLRVRLRVRAPLQHARDRLDRPPQALLGAGTPTREQLIAQLATAGRAFARDYWTDGLPLTFPGVDFGPVHSTATGSKT